MVDQVQNPQAEQPAQPEVDQNARPIILALTLGKVNYIISSLAQLPYEKSYQPIQDLQQMVIAQLQEPWPPVADGAANEPSAE
jgi:hypothetical protein